MLLAVARGAWSVYSSLRPSQPFAAIVLIGLLFLAPAVETYQSIRRPPRYEQIAPVLDAVRAEWQPGDKVYVLRRGAGIHVLHARTCVPPGVILGTEHREASRLSRRTGEVRRPTAGLGSLQPSASIGGVAGSGVFRGARRVQTEILQPGSAAFSSISAANRDRCCRLCVHHPPSREPARPRLIPRGRRVWSIQVYEATAGGGDDATQAVRPANFFSAIILVASVPAMAFAQGTTERKIDPLALPLDKPDVWTLHFRYKPRASRSSMPSIRTARR